VAGKDQAQDLLQQLGMRLLQDQGVRRPLIGPAIPFILDI